VFWTASPSTECRHSGMEGRTGPRRVPSTRKRDERTSRFTQADLRIDETQWVQVWNPIHTHAGTGNNEQEAADFGIDLPRSPSNCHQIFQGQITIRTIHIPGDKRTEDQPHRIGRYEDQDIQSRRSPNYGYPASTRDSLQRTSPSATTVNFQMDQH
jgi:hypothetical protein